MTLPLHLFPSPKTVIGMVHVHALPGTPYQEHSLTETIGTAVQEARTLANAGCDALIIENMHDRPYLLRTVGPEIVSAMTAVGVAVRQAVSIPLGVQILAGANREALAVALACGASFIRAEGFVFAHVADEGLMDSADAGGLLRYRREIGGESIAILADIKKKHASHSLTADVDVAETARAAEFFGADGVVVTGIATGRAANVDEVQAAKEAVRIPVAIGSGLTPDNLECYWPHADAFIVGSYVKREGVWLNTIETSRLDAFMNIAQKLKRA